MELTHESIQYVEQAAKETDSQKRDCYICRINPIADGANIASCIARVGFLPSLLVGSEIPCPSETFRVLKNKEIREFGEYRTQRLVLEAWDQLETGGLY